MLTIKELKDIIKDLPDDMEVICDRCSDYCEVTKDEISVVRAIDKGGWIMRVDDYRLEDPSYAHTKWSLKPKDKERVKSYLHFVGN